MAAVAASRLVADSTATISPEQLQLLVEAGKQPELIDVRTPAEYREVHVEFARNVPLDRLDPAEIMAARNGEQPLYLICKAGGRGQQACDRFRAAGYTNVVNVAGGTQACSGTGLPLVHGKKTMALERQVRIAAGSLVLLGCGLSFWHPYFLGLSAFVGGGLVFAGLTDWCGMGMLLARMPWNK